MVFGALIILATASLALFLFTIIKRKHNFWKNKGIAQLDTASLISNVNLKETIGVQFRSFYEQFKAQGVKHGGVYYFLRPIYVPLDPEIIKSILIKDFNHFVDRGMTTVNEDIDPLSAHLLHLEGDKWKNLRKKLTPTFTSGKMKIMFQTFLDCTKDLEEILDGYGGLDNPIDIKEILGRFTTDIIGSCAFGIECDTMKNSDSEFGKYTKKIIRSGLFTQLRLLALFLFPKRVLRFFHIKIVAKDVGTFFAKVVKDTVTFREANDVYRRDFMHSMLQLKNIGEVNNDEGITNADGTKRSLLTINEISAQCFVFFVAGFESSSTTMSFALYELSTNADVQQKLRTEINEVLSRYNNELTYESIAEMTYLDQVIKETLRKYPALPGLARKCNESYKIPGTDIVLDKGTRVLVPVWGLHMDPDYYPDPERFDPERFSKENEMKRPSCTWIPFGEGPRQCIGLRFGLLQSKLGIATIIRKFKVTLSNKTQSQLKMDPSIIILTPIGKIWLNITKVESSDS